MDMDPPAEVVMYALTAIEVDGRTDQLQINSDTNSRHSVSEPAVEARTSL